MPLFHLHRGLLVDKRHFPTKIRDALVSYKDSDSDSIYFIHKVTIWHIYHQRNNKSPKSDLILVPPEIVFNSLLIELALSELYASVD